MRDSASSFKMYATGRRFCKSFTAHLDLRKRQDLLSYIVNLFSPSDDELKIEVEMNEASMPPLVLAVAPPKIIRAMLKDEDNQGEAHKHINKKWAVVHRFWKHAKQGKA